ncbi:lymphocyte antigen 96 isoform X1 [Pteronotus mesoamericanus]|uniref:lymphocyte antigen 96 isoform X1 n=1 Tax=Pteronotus mesoamericanus TaxID=1884717 RepID=UPI0023EC89AD|nr:lymphocyte antigen 96 isoform X1 [Pteronotus parnellii mesoamericanus]
MFPLMLFSTLFSSTFTEPGEQHWICNSSDASLWYSYCDNMEYPISIKPEPCVTVKGSQGFLHIFFIPRKDIKKLYLNLHLSINTLEFPMRKEVICRGSDDKYSFCGALKGAGAECACGELLEMSPEQGGQQQACKSCAQYWSAACRQWVGMTHRDVHFCRQLVSIWKEEGISWQDTWVEGRAAGRW